jgi:ATP-dependent exoDNAse (exonuclease V) beta subunit
VLPGADGADELWTGAFDRVVLNRAGGRVQSAELIDFKSDRVEGAALAQRAEGYRPQLEAYRRVLARMTGLQPATIRASLLFLHADARVDV